MKNAPTKTAEEKYKQKLVGFFSSSQISSYGLVDMKGLHDTINSRSICDARIYIE